MNLKGILGISTGLMVVCAGLVPSFAYAQGSDIEASHVNVVNNYQTTDGSVIKRTLVKLAPDESTSFTIGKETVQIGGNYATFPPAANSTENIDVAVPMSLSILGRPYGNYNAGCTLCVFSSSSGMFGGGGQAALSGLDYHGTPQHNRAYAVAHGDMATAGFYQYDENSSGRVVTQAASFGPGVVTLVTPMTDEQMSQLHDGMYIATNVIDPAITGSETKLSSHAYWGYIKSWDATHIYVYDWAVLGGGNSAAGQVPNVQHLDSTLSTYKVPMVFVGVSNKIFSKNTYVNADGSNVLGDKATAVANSFEREEFDFRAKNWTKPKSLSFHGWTTSFQCDNCDSQAVSEDSYAYLVNGPNGLPRAYVAQTVGDALEYSGYSTFIGGNGPPQQVDADGNVSSGIIGSNHIMSSFASTLPSNNTIHMNTIINRDSVANNDWRDYSVRLVMDVDGKRDRRAGLTGGSRKGSIAFNYNNVHDGGICLLGFDTNQGLCQEGDGTVNFAKKITAKDDVVFRNMVFTAAAGYNKDQKKVTGQGSIQSWNTFDFGKAHTEFVNVDPANDNGGFDFYDINTGTSVEDVTPLVRLGKAETFFNVTPTMKQGLSITSGKTLLFKNNEGSKGVYLSLDGSYTDADKAAGKADTRGDLLVGTQVLGGGNIRGVNGYYGQSATVSGQVAAASFKGQLSTPASSSASCNAGEFKDDANYHYVCVASNKWKRVALSDF